MDMAIFNKKLNPYWKFFLNLILKGDSVSRLKTSICYWDYQLKESKNG